MKNTSPFLSKTTRIPGLGGLLTASLTLLAACGSYGQSAFSNAVMNLNPVAYWPLQETVQPPAADVEPDLGSLGSLGNIYYASVPNFNNPNLKAMYPGALANESGSTPAMYFAGSTSGFGLVPTTDNQVALPAGKPFSVEMWIQPYTTSQYQGIVDDTGTLGPGGNNALGYKAGWNFNQNYVPLADDGSGTQSGPLYGWSFAVYNGQTSFSGAQALAPYQYLIGTNITSLYPVWYHLVGVFNGTNAYIYVNGVLASSPDYDIPMPAGTSFLPDTWDPIQFGCSRGLDANSWKGGMEEVAIYTNILTPQQIVNHYSIGTNSSLAVGTYANTIENVDHAYMYWRMTAGENFYSDPSSSSFPQAGNFGTLSASTINPDNGGSGYNAFYEPGTLPGVAGPSYAGFGAQSYACAFNGIDGMVDAGYVSAMNPTAASNFTVVGWFKDNPSDNNGRTNTLVSHSGKSWRMSVENGALIWDAGVGTDVHAPAVNINDGNWHMFTGVWNAATTTETVYIDAATSASATSSSLITGNSTTNVILGAAPDYCQVNYYNYTQFNTNYNTSQTYYAGMLAHVAYFNSALTAAQIASLYSASAAPPYILIQPVSASGVLDGGTTNVFAVTASAATNGLVYQWWVTNSGVATMLANDSVHINGANSNTLTITNLVTSESGSYYVVISNSYGVVTSALATMQVSSAPYIVSQTGSGSLQLFVNQGYTLSVTAAGDLPLTYQWYTNGVADTTAGTTSSYGLSDVQLTMSGNIYYCVVSNSVSIVTGVPTTLTVNPLPSSLTSSSYGSAILALTPTGYWPMHEVSSGIPGDIETNLGTLGTNGTAWYGDWDINFSNPSNIVQFVRQVPGAIANDPDTALHFDAGDACCLVVPHANPQTTLTPPFTLECWANPDNNRSTTVLVGQGGGQGLSGGPNYGGVDLQWSGPNVSNTFELTIWNGSGSASTTLASAPIYPAGQWYYVAATYDGTNVVLYVNGTLAGTTKASMASDYWSPLSIGMGRWTTTGGADPFEGAIDEVAVYTNVLSSSVVASHYSAALNGANGAYKNDVLAQNPLLYYRLDAPPYTQPPQSTWPVMYNYGTNALNGVYTPGTVPGSSPVALNGLSSPVAYTGNGMGAFAVAGESPYFNPLGFTSFSYTAFFRAQPTDARSYQDILSGNDDDFRCSLRGNTGAVVGHGTQDQTTTLGIYNDGNWHQVVVTAQGAAGGGSITNLTYVDGVLVVTNNTTSTNNVFGDPGPVLQFGNEFGFNITNSQSGNPAGERCLDGSVCEVAFFYGQVLTSQAVSNLYLLAGVAPFFSQQPFSTNINAGQLYSNNVTAAGSGSAFNLQWYTNGVALAGQTSTNLVYNPAGATNVTSDLYCVVSNNYGVSTSLVAYLTVNTNPVITSYSPASTNLTVLPGVNIPFSVTTVGASPLTYDWISNGVTVASGTSATFTLSNVNAGSAGTYTCVVSNFLSPTANLEASISWTVGIYGVTGPFVPYVASLQPYGYWLLNEVPDNGNGDQGVVCHDYIGGNNGVYENVVLGEQGYNYADTLLTTDADTNTATQFGTYSNPNSCAYNISNVDFSAPSGTTVNFTMMAWVQPTAFMTINTPGIVAKGLYNDEEGTIDCGIKPTGSSYDAYRFSVRNAGAAVVNADSGVVAFSDPNWHLLVGVCDETHGQVIVYIDGTNAGSAAIGTTAGIVSADSSVPLTIGSRSSAGSYSPSAEDQQFIGNIADVAVFKYALQPAQVGQLYLASGVAPSFTAQPVAVTNVTYGTTLNVPTTVFGTAPLSYQWYDINNNPVAGQTNGTLVIANDTSADTYYVTVTNLYGSAISSNVAVTVQTTPEVVGAQPATNTIIDLLPGQSVAFSAEVVGSSPLYYYWLNNQGARIAGATNLAYTLSNVTTSGSGNYTFVVSNYLTGVGYTNGVFWTVVVQPLSGGANGFMANVLSLQPYGYWLMNEPEVGSGDDGVICHDYINGNDGVYENVLLGQNSYDFMDSFAPQYDTNTAAQVGLVSSDNSCAFNISNVVVSSTNNAEFTVQAWVQALQTIPDSVNTPGIVSKGLYNNEQFTIDCGLHAASGYDAYRFETHNAAAVTVNASSGVVAGSDNNWHFLVGVCDEANSLLTLYIDGTNAGSSSMPAGSGVLNNDDGVPMVIGARTSGSPYSPSDMNEQFIGNIADVAVFKYALTSNQVLAEYLAAGIAPQIQPLPASLTNGTGGTLTIAASVVGTAPLYYQWYNASGNQAIAGQTTSTLVIPNDTASVTYYLVVSNAYGTNTSSQTSVEVVNSLTLVQDITPSNAVVLAGATISFTVIYDGAGPITYGWQKNSAAVANSARVSGANSNVLTIVAAQTSDAGTYQLFATNSYGTAQSSQATLGVVQYLTFNGTGVGWYSQSTPSTSLVWEGGNQLQLTADVGAEDSAAFFDSPVYVGGFEAAFTYQVPTGASASADGASFCIQNASAGVEAIGSDGDGLGVEGISPSFEFEFNIYSGNSAGGVGVSFDTDGNIGPIVAPAPIEINNGDPIATVLTYLNGVATVTLTDTISNLSYTFSTNLNIPAALGTNVAYVGFTGGDGADKSTQVVSDFSFVPLPSMSARVSTGNLTLTWPGSIGAFALEESPVLGSSAVWTPVNATPAVVHGENQVTLPVSGQASFFQLVQTNVPSL